MKKHSPAASPQSNPFAALASRLFGAWPRLRGAMLEQRVNDAFGLWLEHAIDVESKVIHAVGGIGFEVDHVLIARAGIFAISVERPGQFDAFDNQFLVNDAIERTRKIARSLGEQLRERLGSWNRVHPVLLVRAGFEPLDGQSCHDVCVKAPKDFLKFVKSRPALLNHTDICQLSYTVSEIERDAQRLTRYLKRTGEAA
jgi:hypothetical protein